MDPKAAESRVKVELLPEEVVDELKEEVKEVAMEMDSEKVMDEGKKLDW